MLAAGGILQVDEQQEWRGYRSLTEGPHRPAFLPAGMRLRHRSIGEWARRELEFFFEEDY